MTAAALNRWPGFPPGTGAEDRESGRGVAGLAMAALTVALLLLGCWLPSALILWSSIVPALWLAATHPVRLVQLLVFTSPIFPVVRLTRDLVGAQQVSSKGLFLSGDDPIIAALAAAWLLATIRAGRGKARVWYPRALISLLLLYPVISAANLWRLEFNQGLVSILYFFKWAEYALLVFAIPRLIRGSAAVRLASSLPRLMMGALLVSAAFASYEVAEALRTGTYTQAAAIPRASAFFGTLDPRKFGASEDPVNFGTYIMVAGSVALAAMSAKGKTGWLPGASFIASLIALLLSASRAPWLAAALAYGRVQRLGSSRAVLAMLAIAFAATSTLAFAPQVWQASFARFEALSEWNRSAERSADSRLQIALHSPVFEIDQFWLIGHGHSSYRFVAEEHLSQITSGVSRSLYNFPLTAWYDSGPAGLVLWVLFFLQMRRKLSSIEARSLSPAVRTLAGGLHGALWGLGMASMFGEVPYNWRVMGVFYLALGVCLAADEAAGAPAGASARRAFYWVIRRPMAVRP